MVFLGFPLLRKGSFRNPFKIAMYTGTIFTFYSAMHGRRNRFMPYMFPGPLMIGLNKSNPHYVTR